VLKAYAASRDQFQNERNLQDLASGSQVERRRREHCKNHNAPGQGYGSAPGTGAVSDTLISSVATGRPTRCDPVPVAGPDVAIGRREEPGSLP
jgi:hypothetical protein